VDHLGQPRLELTARRLLWMGLVIGFPCFALVTVWGDVFFSVAFGDEWREAGRMAMVLAPAMWLCFQTGWIQRVYEATRSQKVSFQIQVYCDLAVIVGVVVTLQLTSGALAAVVAYSILFSVNNILYLVGAFHVAGFARSFLLKALAGASLGYAAFAVVCALPRWIGLTPILTQSLTVLFTLATFGAIALAWRSHSRPHRFQPTESPL
jgi:O-antigen/teichoic acid export membrane protein